VDAATWRACSAIRASSIGLNRQVPPEEAGKHHSCENFHAVTVLVGVDSIDSDVQGIDGVFQVVVAQMRIPERHACVSMA